MARFDPEVVYGRFPPGNARPRRVLASARGTKRGISVPSLPCPSLVAYGDDFREERGTAVARMYSSDELDFPGLDHWALVRDPQVRSKVADWLGIAAPKAERAYVTLDALVVKCREGGREVVP